MPEQTSQAHQFQLEAQALQAYLATRDTACPSCQYNLRGLQSDRCPECNQQLSLGVLLTEPKLAAYITGLVGLAVGAGFGGFLFIYGMLQFVIDSGPTRRDFILKFLGSTGGGLLVEGTLLLIWVLLGKRFRRLPRATRWTLAVLAWVLSAANLAVFSWLIDG